MIDVETDFKCYGREKLRSNLDLYCFVLRQARLDGNKILRCVERFLFRRLQVDGMACEVLDTGEFDVEGLQVFIDRLENRIVELLDGSFSVLVFPKLQFYYRNGSYFVDKSKETRYIGHDRIKKKVK